MSIFFYFVFESGFNSKIKCYSRKKAGNVFLVAFYECEDDFELVEAETDRLYCSDSSWIGERPRCERVSGADEEYGDDNDDGDGDELDEDEEEEVEDEEEEEEDGEGNEGDNNGK